jgi:hypothetical protein
MKGKSSFNKREVELIESLILQRCNAYKSQQKNIRSKMRNLGFYGSDYGVKDTDDRDLVRVITSLTPMTMTPMTAP